MDHMTSLRNTDSHDTVGKYQSANVDSFFNQNSSYPGVQHGHRSSVNSNGQMEFNPPAYSLSAGLEYGHGVPQSYQSNMSDRQMTSSFMCQNQQQQQHSDHFYSYPAQTSPFYPQKHQPATNQLLQSPASPCHNQTSPANRYQTPSPQFASMPAHSQNSQMSPRHLGHLQTPQIPLVYSPKNQQIQSLQNQQAQSAVLINGNNPSQRTEQTSKLVVSVSKQQNSPKDHTCEGMFYANQFSQRNDTPLSNIHRAQASISSFNHRMQAPSPVHATQVFQAGGSNSGNKANGDSQPRNVHGGQYGGSMKAQGIIQSKPSPYACPSSQEHLNTTVPSNLQQNRYGKNESSSNSSQRIQKAASVTSSVSYRPQMPGYYADYNLLPDYSNVASSHPYCQVSSNTQPTKPVPDPSARDLPSVQNMQYKSRNSHAVLSREGENVMSPGNMSTRSVKPINSDSAFLERNLGDYSNSHKMDSNNSHSLFSVTVSNVPAKGGRRGSKVNESMAKGSSRTNEQTAIAQKNIFENLNPAHWYKCPDTSLVSSFQSDIEAMQADIASYVSTSEVSRTSVRAATVPHETAAQRAVESLATGQNRFNQTSQTHDTQKNSVSMTEGQTGGNSSKSSPANSKNIRAAALAAIQIKQELVDSLNKYKTGSSSSIAHNVCTNSTSVTDATSQISSTNTRESVRDTNILTNRLPQPVTGTVPQPVTGTAVNTHHQSQSDISARRHSSAEIGPRPLEMGKTLHYSNTSANQSFHIQANSKTPESSAQASTGDFLHHQKVSDNYGGSGHVLIQNRRHTTTSYLLDGSPMSRYETFYSPDQKQNVDSQRSSAQRQRMDSQDFPSQSIIYQLFDQVQSIEVQGSSGQQQNVATIKENIQGVGASTVDTNGQRLSGTFEKKVYPARENIFDTAEQFVRRSPAGGTEQNKGRSIAVSQSHNQPGKSSDLGANISKYTSFITDLPSAMKETINQPVPNAALHNYTSQETASGIQKLIKMETSNESNKATSTIICYVMLHGHQLICLKSAIETLLLLCQFQLDCFPDKNIESITSCIDQTLKISKKVLNHQDRERIVSFLRKNGYQVGGVVHTISLDDARHVYHHVYGIKCCTNAECVVEMFHLEVDLDAVVSSFNNRSTTTELKKQKESADDKNYGQMLPSINPRTPSVNCSAKEHHQGKVEDIVKQPMAKPLSTLPSLQHSGCDQKAAHEKNVECDELDDLILVEASEDPHVVRWSGDAPKVGGMCNTIIGQLRSYIHEKERFLVVDDLCRIFGSAAFYDGVDRENIILYSCCQEIANFLNALNVNFSPLQSLRHSLVKEKDIGIQITDSNYVPVECGLEKGTTGSQFLKRPLCKQEIIDDDCSSPKQFRLENSARAPELDNQRSVEQQPLMLNQREHHEEAVIDTVRSDCLRTDVSELQNMDTLVAGVEGKNKMVQDVSSVISASFTDNSPNQPFQDNNVGTANSNVSLVVGTEGAKTAVQDIHNEDYSTADSRSSSQLLEKNSDSKSVNNDYSKFSTTHSQVSEHDCSSEPPPTAVTVNTAGISNSLIVNVKEADISTVQPSHSSGPQSSILTTAFEKPPSPALSDLSNPASSLSESRVEKVDQNKWESKKSKLASHDGQHFGDLLTESTSDNRSCAENVHISVQQSLDSENKANSDKKESVEMVQTTLSKQGENLKINLASMEAVGGSLEDLMLAQQNATSSILKARMEKIKHILETRKHKALPLPRLPLEGSSNLSLLTKDGCNAKDKNSLSDVSGTEAVEEKLNNLDHNSAGLNIQTEKPSGTIDVSCLNTVITSGHHDQEKDESDLIVLGGLKVNTAKHSTTINSNTAITPELPVSSEQATSVLPPQKRTRNVLSVLDLDKDQAPLSLLPPSRYFPDNSRSVDDIDVMFSGGVNLLDHRPSSYWKAYTKLWQEHRALLGTVSALKMSLAHAKAEKERSEKISKYFEGVIHDITSTFLKGDEETPVIIDDDSLSLEYQVVH